MATAPTGTVTLVFTDIQGSTALWEYFGKSFKPLLDRHNAIVRAAIAKYGGYEVKTEGDAFMVAFGEALSAVRFCLEVQEQLHAAPWPPSLLEEESIAEVAGLSPDGGFRGLRIRMGIHTGEPTFEIDPTSGRMDYFGRMVNRAARVGGVGHGGQVLLSNATWGQVQDHLESTQFQDLGDHALKGLEAHERIWQVMPASLAKRVFPRIKTPYLEKTNLPLRLDSFVGRAPQLQALAERLVEGKTRLLTLLGAGGTGKTRLAERFGGLHLDDFPGGVWFCDLSETHSLEGVLSAIGRALEVPLTSKDPTGQLGDALHGRGELLVILDNFEQVVDHGSSTVGAWTQRAPAARFLVTSRRPLGLGGEQVLALEPMSPAESVRLFEERAQLARSDFRVTEDNRPVVAEVVERLDCMALAIELAAARVRTMPPEKIRARLSERFRLLRGQRRDQAARQATLEGAIAWSWELLKPWEQAALAQCSVFRGGFDVEAAEAIVELESFDEAPWAVDVVTVLLDHSLLRVGEPIPGSERFGLYESIRVYASEKLQDQGPEAAASLKSRHAAYYSGLGRQEHIDSLYTHGGAEVRRKLLLELDNLSGAVEASLAANQLGTASLCTVATAVVSAMTGPFLERASLVGRVLDSDGLAPHDRARLLLAYGRLLRLGGLASDAATAYESSLVIARSLGARPIEGEVLKALGLVRFNQGRIQEAEEFTHAALECFRALGSRRAEASLLSDLGALDRSQGRLQEALKHQEAALVLAREVGSRHVEAVALSNLGNLHMDQGHPQEAEQYYTEALSMQRELGDRQMEGVVHGCLAVLCREQGRPEGGLEHCLRGLSISREVGDRRNEGILLCSLGILHIEQGHVQQAMEAYQKALALNREVGDRRSEGNVLGTLALLHGRQGRIDQAVELHEASLAVAREVGNPHGEGLQLGNLGDLLLGEGDLDGAEPRLEEAIGICDSAWPAAAGAFRGSLALIRAERGQLDEARALLAQGEEQTRGIYAFELAKLLCKRAQIEQEAGEFERAQAARSEAEALAVELVVGPESELARLLSKLGPITAAD